MSGQIKGWCPSAHRPMMSGDGLLVRIRPRKARLDAGKVHALCDLSQTYGNGMIDVTSRANLQIRGVTEAGFPALLERLISEGLVDADPAQEAKRSFTVMPFWRAGDLTDRLAQAFETVAIPKLPDKMGVVVDTGAAPMLANTSGDFRFETTDDGALILRAEGAVRGHVIKEEDATSALTEMVDWFLATGGVGSGRMARHLKVHALPEAWQTTRPRPSAGRPGPGGAIGGRIFGVPFGQAYAADLAELVGQTGARALRVTPWRMLFLEEAMPVGMPGFLSTPDPILDVHACPGAPACAQATVATRNLARMLGPQMTGTLHISGCDKGCARRAPAATTLVGRNGRFDLVLHGTPADTPTKRGLTQAEVLELFA